MPYMLAHGNCCLCGAFFSFNPLTVPSKRSENGQREPVCLDCVTAINDARQEKGEKPFSVALDAYDAAECD